MDGDGLHWDLFPRLDLVEQKRVTLHATLKEYLLPAPMPGSDQRPSCVLQQ
eukprot:SAG11_NODE_25904_length_352_cov_1.003953_1_plen_50_part_10